jgi:hypothetical protein
MPRLISSDVGTSPEINDSSCDNNGSHASPTNEDLHLTYLPGLVQGIRASRGQEDGDYFEVNRHDEHHLPFVGHGVAQSYWRIELPPEKNKTFDYKIIAEAALQLRYTGRERGDRLGDAAFKLIGLTRHSELE